MPTPDPAAPTRGDPPGVRARALSASSGDTQPAFFEPSPRMPGQRSPENDVNPAARLDFGDEDVGSVFVDPEVAPEMVDGFYDYTMTLKPEIAEELSNDLDATLAAVNRMLVTRFGMSSEGVFYQDGSVEGEDEDVERDDGEYIMNFKSESDPAKMVGIRIPVGGGVSNIFIRISTAFTEEEASGTILYDIDNVISDLSSPLQDNVDPMMLSGRNDENLTFYERLAPRFSLEGPSAKPLPINNTVYDQEASDYVMLQDFVLPGNKLVFLLNGKQIGISYAPFIKNIREGNSIFYECSQVFSYNPGAGQLGTFEPYEIFAQPYIELALTSRIYITRDDFNKLLSVPVHPYWEIKDAGRTLNATASRSSVVQGGPVQSMLHCQDGSDLKVYTIEAYMPTKDEEEEEEECEIPQIVTLQIGEERIQVDISLNNTALGAKTWLANEKSIDVRTIQFQFRGNVLYPETPLVPGTVVLVNIVDPDLEDARIIRMREADRLRALRGARRTYRRNKRRRTNKKLAK